MQADDDEYLRANYFNYGATSQFSINIPILD